MQLYLFPERKKVFVSLSVFLRVIMTFIVFNGTVLSLFWPMANPSRKAEDSPFNISHVWN